MKKEKENGFDIDFNPFTTKDAPIHLRVLFVIGMVLAILIVISRA